jgi:hypothetical protein
MRVKSELAKEIRSIIDNFGITVAIFALGFAIGVTYLIHVGIFTLVIYLLKS